ncbi:hypothetical protein PAPYR_6401 [Paratrimastix pyriformis]|uniref:Uncharacterized protein n=1 Tax=Paratrimastix pyriformis TaxID=342808 RepID=A0ABQ8UHU5_9EUKA|nr:hypothetical protein PAPYR_6401 [Paratrimastix pyriformis]
MEVIVQIVNTTPSYLHPRNWNLETGHQLGEGPFPISPGRQGMLFRVQTSRISGASGSVELEGDPGEVVGINFKYPLIGKPTFTAKVHGGGLQIDENAFILTSLDHITASFRVTRPGEISRGQAPTTAPSAPLLGQPLAAEQERPGPTLGRCLLPVLDQGTSDQGFLRTNSGQPDPLLAAFQQSQQQQQQQGRQQPELPSRSPTSTIRSLPHLGVKPIAVIPIPIIFKGDAGPGAQTVPADKRSPHVAPVLDQGTSDQGLLRTNNTQPDVLAETARQQQPQVPPQQQQQPYQQRLPSVSPYLIPFDPAASRERKQEAPGHRLTPSLVPQMLAEEVTTQQPHEEARQPIPGEVQRGGEGMGPPEAATIPGEVQAGKPSTEGPATLEGVQHPVEAPQQPQPGHGNLEEAPKVEAAPQPITQPLGQSAEPLPASRDKDIPVFPHEQGAGIF